MICIQTVIDKSCSSNQISRKIEFTFGLQNCHQELNLLMFDSLQLNVDVLD